MCSEDAFFRIVPQSAGCNFQLTLERFQLGWSLNTNVDNARPLWALEGTDATQMDIKAVEGVRLGVDQSSQTFHIFRWGIPKKF
jgi:hypothetical protein